MPIDKKQELLKMLSTLDEERLTKTDFTSAFKHILEIIIGKETKLEHAVAKLEETYHTLLNKMTQDSEARHKELSGKVDNVFVGERVDAMERKLNDHTEKMERMMNEMMNNKIHEVDDRLSKVKDGYTPIKGKDYFDGKHATLNYDDITEKLKGKLTLDSVKDLREVLKMLAQRKTGGGRKVPMLRVIDLTSQVDGVVTTYTLPRDVVRVHQVWSSQFPTILRPVTDFTLAGQTLTLTAQVGVIQSGQTLTCLIETLFYA